jgi:hypothetical protein
MSDSSPSVMWPILGPLMNVTSSPFEIGAYDGPGKPNDFNQFLKMFTDEANYLMENGLDHNGKIIPVELHCFTCDAPAWQPSNSSSNMEARTVAPNLKL